MSTSECSCRLCPTPGMYVVTSMPVVSRTRATLRSAEFGFFGVWVKTRVQTPRRCGELLSAGVLVFSGLVCRPLRTSWAIVGTPLLPVMGFPQCCWETTRRRVLAREAMRAFGRLIRIWGGLGVGQTVGSSVAAG